MTESLPVTMVIINYRTPDLTERAIASVRRHYPHISLLLIDNGSYDGKSVPLLTAWKSRHPQCVELLLNTRNLHHGPAIDQAAHNATLPFLFLLDSDCEILKDGVVEKMLQRALESPLHYAVGKKIWMDHRGFDLPAGKDGAIPYIRPLCMLVRRDVYLSLPRAERHGAPCLANMREAVRRGYMLVDFPIEEFVHHEGRGTAERFGYQLGWRGKLNYALHKLHL
jgi:hypothetical protein